jgi:hypothetical protein
MDDLGTPPRMESREDFAQAVRWGFAAAVADGARCITCVDPGFELWPLDDAPLLESLTAWLRLPQRRLVLLAASYDEVPRRQSRFTAWRRDWTHAIQALQCAQEFAADLPTLLIDDRRTCVHLIDPVHGRGRAERDARSRLLWQDKVDVVLQRSEPAFAVTTLGL